MSTYPAILTAFLVVMGALCLWTLVSIPLAMLLGRVMSDRRTEDEQTAADWGEPSRAEVESLWLFADDAFLDAPIYQRLLHERYDAEVKEAMAEVDVELPVVLDGRWS